MKDSSPSRPTISRSAPVRSSQRAPHSRLREIVRRHVDSQWRTPIHPGSAAAFDQFLDAYDGNRDDSRPLIIDAGCGTGISTGLLAAEFPQAMVIGIDRSAHRLARAPRNLPPSALLLRARLEDFWRLLAEAGIRPWRQFVLYPNPWPKPAQFKRRWHGHPVFPTLVSLGGSIELRCNWQIYAEEFALAADLCGARPAPVVSFQPETPLSAFERKYAASGHPLYRLVIEPEKSK